MRDDVGERRSRSGGDQRAYLFAADDADDVALLAHAEDHHGHVVVAAEGDGGLVHDAEVETDDVGVGDLGELGGFGVELGVRGVDAVDGGGFEEDVGFDLHGAEAGGGVGGEEGVSGAGGEDDDAIFFEVAHGAAADVGFGDLVHLDGGHDATVEAELFDGVLKGDGVDDGGEHAHVICSDAVHVDGLLGDAAEEVSASDDDADLAAEGVDGGDLRGYFMDEDGVDTEAAAGGQGFTGELEEDSFVHVRVKYRMGFGGHGMVTKEMWRDGRIRRGRRADRIPNEPSRILMKNFARSLAIACAALYLLLVIVVFFAIRRTTGGHFVYSMDDPYIHLALAENIARGHYGINASEASSPSSSLLWPLLLVPFAERAWHVYVPLFWNILFGLTASCLIGSAVARWFPLRDGDGRAEWWKRLLTAALMMMVANLVGLTLLGMEHVLQVLLAICCALGMIEALEGRRIPTWCLVAAVVGPMVRYENVGLTVAVCVALWGLGERKKAAVVLGLSVAPLLGFSLFLRAHGLPMLPTSVMVKGDVYSEHLSAAHRLVRIALGNLEEVMRKSARWPVVAMFLVFVPLAWNERGKMRRYVFASAVLVAGMHLAFGRFGWFYRYEVYALIFLTMILLRVVAERPVMQYGFFVLGLLYLASPYMAAIPATVQAASELYGQQYQMHRFANDFYHEDFAVNDLGVVSYQKPKNTYVLDLFGLASPEASRQTTKSAPWMEDVVRRHGVKLAMIYPEWFHVPVSWKPEAKMCLPKEPQVAGKQCVVFYWTSDEPDGELRDELARFATTLPRNANLQFDPERREGGYPIPGNVGK
jgi:hypothetical protein